MTCNFFMVPTSPDYFSVMAIDSLTTVLPSWRTWAKSAQSLQILQVADYPFPSVTPQFLGTIVQKYRPRGRVSAVAFQEWIDEIGKVVAKRLVPALQKQGMLLVSEFYTAAKMDADYCLATIPDFNSLIAKSQSAQTPVFALTAAQIGQGGIVLERTEKFRDRFRRTFTELADRVVSLTTHAKGA